MVDNLKIENIDEIMSDGSEEIALSFEFKLSLNSYLKDLVASPVKSLADVIAFNEKNSKLVSIQNSKLVMCMVYSKKSTRHINFSNILFAYISFQREYETNPLLFIPIVIVS